MSPKLVRAAALVAVSVLSIGVTSAPVAVERVAGTPAAQHQVEDPAAAHLAAEKGLSMAEAQRRIAVQQRAPQFDEALVEALGPTHYGGVWIGDDDRVKVGVIEPATRSAMLAAAATNQLAGEVDLVPVRHSLAALLVANNWLADQVIKANVGAPSALGTGYTTADNSVQLGLPPETREMTPAQWAVLHEARQRYGSMLSTYTVAGPSRLDAADCDTQNDRLSCDGPLRGAVWIGGPRDNPFCTLGFLARGRTDNRLYGLTAGHCLDGEPNGTAWHAYDKAGTIQVRLGPQIDSEYPTRGDAGIIEITNVKLRELAAACRCSWTIVLPSPPVGGLPGTTRNERYPILRDNTSSVGMRVCHTGTRSGTSCGEVMRLGVLTDDGVPNLAETNYCSGDGDSGGPVYAGNTAYGLHHGSRGFCASLYQGIRGAENLMNVDILFDKAPIPGATHFRQNKDQLTSGQYRFSRTNGDPCHYRVRYGDFGDVAYAQVRFYATAQGTCFVHAVEVFGENFGEVWGKTLVPGPSALDECGRYTEVQATSDPGHSAAGMAIVTPDDNRIYFSHTYTDLPFNNSSACP